MKKYMYIIKKNKYCLILALFILSFYLGRGVCALAKNTGKNGKVKALQNGTATIKATAKDGSGVSASCKITYKLGKGKNNDQNPEYYYNQKVNLKAASKKGYNHRLNVKTKSGNK